MQAKRIGIIFGIALLAGLSAWRGSALIAAPANASTGPSGKTRNADAGTVIDAVMAKRQDVPIELEAHGIVAPLSMVEIRPQITNVVKAVHIKEGQFVHAGDLLFSLDERADKAALEKAQAQLARDQALLADLELQYKRSEELVTQKFISQGASDTLRTQVDVQRSQARSSQSALQSAQLTLSYSSIRAPLSGRVGAINVFPGSLVQPSMTLAGVTQIDPIAVSFTVPEGSLQALLDAQRRSTVGVTALRVNAGANAETPLHGKLSFIDSAVDPVAGTIRVKAEFDNRDALLWPGQYVNTRLSVGVLKGAVVVPLAAIVTGADGKFVYSVEQDRTAKVRPIELLHAFETNAAVSGLAGGETIIVDGKQNLRAGSKVMTAQADAGATPKKKNTAEDPGRGDKK